MVRVVIESPKELRLNSSSLRKQKKTEERLM
jgi:hypothetical protein